MTTASARLVARLAAARDAQRTAERATQTARCPNGCHITPAQARANDCPSCDAGDAYAAECSRRAERAAEG